MGREIKFEIKFSDYEDPRLTISSKINKARCPECGEEIFCPGGGWQRFQDGSRVPFGNPVVMCRDCGHWLGLLSECINSRDANIMMTPLSNIRHVEL